jgi:hypothetical protein
MPLEIERKSATNMCGNPLPSQLKIKINDSPFFDCKKV